MSYIFIVKDLDLREKEKTVAAVTLREVGGNFF
jgi:hypothetical protein